MQNPKLREDVETINGREFKTTYSLHYSARSQTTRVDYRIDGSRVAKKDFHAAKAAARAPAKYEPSDAEVAAYIARLAAADLAAGIE